jgi:Ring finger domain
MFKPGHESNDEVECSICLEDFDAGAVLLELPCRHRFHPHCIREWFKGHNFCPLCKFVLTTREAAQVASGEVARQQPNASGGAHDAAAVALDSPRIAASSAGAGDARQQSSGDAAGAAAAESVALAGIMAPLPMPTERAPVAADREACSSGQGGLLEVVRASESLGPPEPSQAAHAAELVAIELQPLRHRDAPRLMRVSDAQASARLSVDNPSGDLDGPAAPPRARTTSASAPPRSTAATDAPGVQMNATASDRQPSNELAQPSVHAHARQAAPSMGRGRSASGALLQTASDTLQPSGSVTQAWAEDGMEGASAANVHTPQHRWSYRPNAVAPTTELAVGPGPGPLHLQGSHCDSQGDGT